MYELAPVRLSKRSKYVSFTDAMERSFSALRHLDRLQTPLVLAYGTCETPEFQRQSRDFAAAVKAAGKPVELLVGEGYNHFEILETIANPVRPARPRHAGADGIGSKLRRLRGFCLRSGLGGFRARCGSIRRRSAGRHKQYLRLRR